MWHYAYICYSHLLLVSLFLFVVQLQRPTDLVDRVDSLASMKGCHFCFLGEGGEPPVTVAGLAAAAASQAQQPYGHTNHHAQVTVIQTPSTRSSAVVKSFISVFLKKGFKYVSNCEGGYAACHAIIMASDHAMELIDHHQEDCLECTGRRKIKEKKVTQTTTEGMWARSRLPIGWSRVRFLTCFFLPSLSLQLLPPVLLPFSNNLSCVVSLVM